MSDMKCPFCQQELDYDDLLGSCINEDCEESFDMVGTESLWRKVIDLKQEIDRTRKALEIAVDALKWIDETYNLGMGYEAAIMEKCELALEQITALEQKDK